MVQAAYTDLSGIDMLYGSVGVLHHQGTVSLHIRCLPLTGMTRTQDWDILAIGNTAAAVFLCAFDDAPRCITFFSITRILRQNCIFSARCRNDSAGCLCILNAGG